MNKHLIETMIHRLSEMADQDKKAFPPLLKDYSEQEIDHVIDCLCGYAASAAKVRELEEQIRAGEDQLVDLRADVESLRTEVRQLEDELARERDR